MEISGSDILTTDYTFVDGIAENSTTILVDSMTNAGNGWDNTLSYTYDCKGNIKTISENGEQKAKYYYDSLNQLVREDNAWTNKTVVYTYDNGGNILNVEEYTLTSASDISSLVASSTDTYAYTDLNWKDKLTSFNGNEITYDEIGNPLNYYNGLNFDWQNGRQLASVSGNGLDISYTYNANGIRTSKTVNGVTTIYTLEGSNVVKETNGTDTLWYYYDATGYLTGFELNGILYLYIKNVQGDITAITDISGNIVVEYIYDSWGELVSIAGLLADTVGIKNPYRYRGYYYDSETDLYYLNSRYYDYNIRKFMNPDSYVSTGQGLSGYNMFGYCLNNPVNRIDSLGGFSHATAINNSNAMVYGGGGRTNYIPKEKRLYYKAVKKYNKNTINFSINKIENSPGKLNVVFYPDKGNIHIENSYVIKDKYEKLAVINVIMGSEYYDQTIYGNCVDTMLIEWSAHNFVYNLSKSSKLMLGFFKLIGYDDPIQSSRGVDFRKTLEPRIKKRYEFVTLGGAFTMVKGTFLHLILKILIILSVATIVVGLIFVIIICSCPIYTESICDNCHELTHVRNRLIDNCDLQVCDECYNSYISGDWSW